MRNLNSSRINDFFANSIQQICENSWQKCGPPDEHKASFKGINAIKIFGYKVFETIIEQGEQFGLAIGNVKLKIQLGNMKFQVNIVEGTIPVEPNKQVIINKMFIKKHWFAKLVSIFLYYGLVQEVSHIE